MIRGTWLCGGVAVLALGANPAKAQQVAQRLAPVVAEGDRVAEPYASGDGVDSGTTRIERNQVAAQAPGSGDVNQLLKLLPSVQFSRSEGLASRESLQDIRPADISISGGRFYENLFTLDGVDVSSRLDSLRAGSAFARDDLAGATAQGLWVDSNLVGAIILRDANVSAEYGRFTGGALDVETRDPTGRLGLTATVNHTSDALVRFKVSDAARRVLGDDLPGRPDYEKWRFGGTLDIPVADRVSVLLGYNRSQSRVTYLRGVNYANAPFGQESASDNYLGKVRVDLGDRLDLTGQVTYSPFRAQAAAAAGLENQITTHGGGLVAKLALRKRGDFDWSLDASLSRNDTDREAQPFNYVIPRGTTNGDFCSQPVQCVRGGLGDLTQRQDVAALRGRASRALPFGTVAAGIDYQRVDAVRTRATDGGAYITPLKGTNIVCAAGDTLDCVTGQYVLTGFQAYRAYRADVSLDSVAGWAELTADVGALTLRGGVRYDHESYLSNNNLAPRLSASYRLPWDGWSVTLGANRYYGRSLLAYALREQTPGTVNLVRTPTIVNGQRVYSNNFAVSTASRPALDIGRRDLDTPYSDELSATLQGRVLGGSTRLRGIYREGRDEFSRTEAGTRTAVLETGRTVTYNVFALTNEGYSSYRGASLEWTRSLGRHAIGINLNWSKTRSSNADFDVDVDPLLTGIDVLFAGNVVDLGEALAQNQRQDFAAPLLVNATLTSRWLGDRVTSNVSLRYRNAFTQVEDTGVNQRVNGVLYDVYDFRRYPGLIDVNLNAQAELIRTSLGTFTGDVRVSNVLDNTPAPAATATSQPYQLGRSFWLGLSFRY